ncbi:MAG: hypothetical protein CMN71_12605 [Sphingomonadaceae bacterium]|nr:hypothetical protein [Sphingomonadaceae bacterium]
MWLLRLQLGEFFAIEVLNIKDSRLDPHSAQCLIDWNINLPTIDPFANDLVAQQDSLHGLVKPNRLSVSQ